ncbi:MAG: PAS domain S-box protein [Deltaproteobacteria bacterium]|nr:PAS domain S-box protein [Deltaproteobacteria bacterium]
MDEIAKILIVEDEQIIALEMKRKLESMGYDVPAIVSSGKEAIMKAQELQPDLVLMDIILRGEMDGVEAAGQIRARFGIPVVYITANVNDARLEEITRSEPFGCLFKPFEDMELQAAVKMALYKYEMEKKLLESEEKFRSVVENSHDGILIVGEDYRFTYVNDMFCRIVGYPNDEIVGQDFTKFIDEEGKKLVADRYKRRQAGKKLPPRYEFNVVRKDGTKRRVEISPAISKDSKGKVRTIAQILDITDRRRTEESLRKSEERFRTIFESQEEGYCELDLAGRFTFFNETMLRIMGFPAEELMGMSYKEYTSPEIAKRLYGIFNKIYRTGESAKITDYEFTRKDGGKRTMELSTYLIRDEKGNPVGFSDIVRDVTKRKQMEALLVKSEERFRNLVENMSEIIYTADEKGILNYVSPAVEQVTGYKPSEITGRSLVEFLHPEDVSRVADRFLKIISGVTDPSEYRLLIKSGETVWVRTHSRPIYKNNRIVGIQGVLTDITDRRRAEEEISAYQEHIELINKILRHDLTNDLVVMQSALNLYNNSPEEEFLKEISSHTEKSLELIGQMGELESFISRHRELKILEIRDAIDEVIKNYPSIDFEIRGKAQAMADNSLVSVIDNIVRNAIIHGKANRIAITTGRKRELCEVRIADNGTGIPDEIKEKIFEEGFMHGDTGHAGLGLHIVQKAMESYGGYAWVEDNKPKGTVIVLRFRMVK